MCTHPGDPEAARLGLDMMTGVRRTPMQHPSAVIVQARAEIAEEKFRAAVDAAKVKIRARRWWHALVPFRIVILRRD